MQIRVANLDPNKTRSSISLPLFRVSTAFYILYAISSFSTSLISCRVSQIYNSDDFKDFTDNVF